MKDTEFDHALQTWFSLSPSVLGEISRHFQPISLKKDAYFIKIGQYPNTLAFVKSGIIREYFPDHHGREITKWIATPGYFLTDLSGFLFHQPARCNFQALTEVQLLAINREQYQKIGQWTPQWPDLEKLFIAKCFAELENRVSAHLSLSGEERYQMLFDRQPELFNLVPLQYLASMLGMTPETFSRIRKKRSRMIS